MMNLSDYHEKPSRLIQNKKKEGNAVQIADNRQGAALQAKLVETLQCQADEEDELLQGKFTTQLQEEDEELLQGKFNVAQRQSDNLTGMPDPVKQRMETSFGRDFSSVRVHENSSLATDLGALAFTQGKDISFAPGQFKPDTSAGLKLLGHELTHVEQQDNNRVSPNTSINGMSVNDDPGLEHEADVKGAIAAR